MDAGPPRSYESRYRLYLDELGDHVFNALEAPRHRYLCLLGCWFQNPEYQAFHDRLIEFKRAYVPHHPDDPPILHREDIVNRRKSFAHLRDRAKASAFDDNLLELIGDAAFKVVGVVVDKKELRDRYGDAAAHPYNLSLGFMLQRYCGYLNHISRRGDVLAEGRGGKEDLILKASYRLVFGRGAWMVKADVFRQALTSGELKVKRSSENIAGLQLADLLAHPVKESILRDEGHDVDQISPFDSRLMEILDPKFNRHLYDGRVRGYGKVLYPK